MYQPKVRHVLSPVVPDQTGIIAENMWPIFAEIGKYWGLSDPVEQYRIRFESFVRNRISLNPLYAGYYKLAETMLQGWVDELGRERAIARLFTDKDHRVPSQLSPPQLVPETPLEAIQVYVINEFISYRIALGGFFDFGALYYCGWFGGANLDPKNPPYRPAVLK